MKLCKVRSILVVGLLLGIGIWLYGFLYGLCGTFGPLTTSPCLAYAPYEVIGPILVLITLAGLVYSFLVRRDKLASGISPN